MAPAAHSFYLLSSPVLVYWSRLVKRRAMEASAEQYGTEPVAEAAERLGPITLQDIGAFRAALREVPLRPLEDFSGRAMSAREAQKRAAEVLSEGWTRRGYPAVDLAKPIPWEESAQRNRSWSFYLHCWDLLDALLLAYQNEDDTHLLDPCLRVARDWVGRFSCVQNASVFAWYDMAVGVRAARLGFLIDAAARLENFSDEDILLLVGAAERHRDYLADDRNIAFHSNHGFYQAAGQAALARRLASLPGMSEGYEQAARRLQAMLDRQFCADHVHNEHSPDYHRMVVRTLGSLLISGLLDDPAVMQRYIASERALAWFVMPHGLIVNFGDSDPRDMKLEPSSAERQWRTDEMRWAVTNGAQGHPPAGEHALFSESGYFVVRQRHDPSNPEADSYLALAAAFHSRIHKHADDLSFVWSEFGEPILIDAGRYGYSTRSAPGSDLHKAGFWYTDPARVFCESTHAHNTVEIDATSYQRRQEQPYGSAIVRAGRTGNTFHCQCQALHFKTVQHNRTILFLPRQWLIAIDLLSDLLQLRHRYAQWWHFACGSKITTLDASSWCVGLRGSNRNVHVSSLAPLRVAADILEGQREPRLQGWWSPSEEILEPAPTLGFSCFAEQGTAIFVTLFSLAGKPEKPSVTIAERSVLEWIDERGSHSLYIDPPENTGDAPRISYAVT